MATICSTLTRCWLFILSKDSMDFLLLAKHLSRCWGKKATNKTDNISAFLSLNYSWGKEAINENKPR